MILMKWDPFRDLILLRDRVNKLFEESLSKVDLRDAALSFGAWLPAVDIFETRDTIVVKVEVPGMDKNEFFVSIKNNNLIIKGERGIKKGKKEEHYSRAERAYGPFQRIFSLPCEVEQSNLEAKYSNGIIELVLKKSEKAKPRQIKVE